MLPLLSSQCPPVTPWEHVRRRMHTLLTYLHGSIQAGHLFYKDLLSGFSSQGLLASLHTLAPSGATGDTTGVTSTVTVNWNCSNMGASSSLRVGASGSPTRTPRVPQAAGVWLFVLPFVCIWEWDAVSIISQAWLRPELCFSIARGTEPREEEFALSIKKVHFWSKFPSAYGPGQSVK